ncbi:hypothetical protein GE061_015533 [Apolygus lucorum]|uniref:Uncharacterized protein n=1 Tax=Apolygus lucorum TaxID=248454 RepID=A0A8S9XLE1_APOLU|nr:hypothetical protein GE061_015533 [Apolygus lucorum]
MVVPRRTDLLPDQTDSPYHSPSNQRTASPLAATQVQTTNAVLPASQPPDSITALDHQTEQTPPCHNTDAYYSLTNIPALQRQPTIPPMTYVGENSFWWENEQESSTPLVPNQLPQEFTHDNPTNLPCPESTPTSNPTKRYVTRGKKYNYRKLAGLEDSFEWENEQQSSTPLVPNQLPQEVTHDKPTNLPHPEPTPTSNPTKRYATRGKKYNYRKLAGLEDSFETP